MKSKIIKITIALVLVLAFCCCMTACDSGSGSGSDSGEVLLAGEGTTASPYLISSKDDMVEFATNVGTYSYVNGSQAYVKVTADINLEGMEWTPIGASGATFAGVFDGGDYLIYDCNIVAGDLDSVGFFSVIYSNSDGSVPILKNINMSGISINSASNHSAIGGLVGSSYAKIMDCDVNISINLTGQANAVGGVVGEAFEAVTNTTSAGTMLVTAEEIKATSSEISNSSPKYGGVIGVAQSSSSAQSLTNKMDITFSLINYSTLTSNKISYTTGGVIGQINNSSSVFSNLVNNGDIKGVGSVGGIVGDFYGNGATISSCTNNGALSSTGGFSFYVGGIVAKSTNTSANKIEFCLSSGDITLTTLLYDDGVDPLYSGDYAWAGGILASGTTTIDACKVTGDITASGLMNTCVGGIAGGSGGIIKDSYCTSDITVSSNNRIFAGGLLGVMEANSGVTLTSCYYSGLIIARTESTADYYFRLAGILGYNHATSGCDISNNYYDATVLTEASYDSLFEVPQDWCPDDANEDGEVERYSGTGIENNVGATSDTLMSSSLTGFTSVADGGYWVFVDGEYPTLSWEV